MSIQTPQVVIPQNYNDVTFELEILSMKTIDEPNPDTVKEVSYRLYGSEGEYKSSHSRTLYLDTESTGSFVLYNNLTRENVEVWIETLSNFQLDKYSVCNIILDQKANQENSKALPW